MILFVLKNIQHLHNKFISMEMEDKAELVTSKLNHLTAWLHQQDDLESLLKQVQRDGRLNGELRKQFRNLRDREFYDSLFPV